jgi:hypothetical protein
LSALSLRDDAVHVLQRLAAPQLVDHVVHELEQLTASSRIGTSARWPKSISRPSMP